MTPSLGYFDVKRTGPLSLLVDQGRIGFNQQGITVGGPMDKDAFDDANFLCGNHSECCCIESTLGGLVLVATQHTQIALTGQGSSLKINDRDVPSWQLIDINTGDNIELVQNNQGLRSYFAVAGGFLVKPQFGSCTTVTRDSLGGLCQDGSPLKPGDKLTFEINTKRQRLGLKTANNWQAPERITLRIITGYQFNDFDIKQRVRFFHSEYGLTPEMDRMAIKLSGPPIEVPYTQMQSEGISFGALQIPPDGQPIIMLCDRQTIGGYPKLGSVLSLDCYKLAQLRPGTKVQFEPIEMYDAHNLLHLHHARKRRTEFI